MNFKKESVCLFLLGVSQLGYGFSGGTQAISGKTNPDVSINILTLGRAATDGGGEKSETPNGLSLQEVEAGFIANVDPYFRGVFTLSVHSHEGEYRLDPEEAFAETLNLAGVAVRAGKFKADLGRLNGVHTHAQPFIDLPMTHQKILGEEGLNDVGIGASFLLPTSWFFEITPQIFAAQNEYLFHTATHDDVAGVTQIRNLWDLSQNTTLEWDLGYGIGKNEFKGFTNLYSSALTTKWKPMVKSSENSLSFTTEFLRAVRKDADIDGDVGGVVAWAQWQFARRWWLQAREEFLGVPAPEEGYGRKHSALLGFVPTEFSMLRLQYDAINQGNVPEWDHRVALQLNVSLGAHPAHSY